MGYTRTNVIRSRTSFVIAYSEIYVFRGNPFEGYSKVTVQHNHLNRKNIIQNQKYKFKNNIKLIYLNLYDVYVNLKSISNLSLVKTTKKLFVIKIIKKSRRGGRRGIIFPSHLGWLSCGRFIISVEYRGGFGCSNLPLPEISKALQNHAKLNPIVKTVKNCWSYDANTPRCLEKETVNF